MMVGDQLVIGRDVSHFAAGLDDHRFPLFADDRGAVLTPGTLLVS